MLRLLTEIIYFGYGPIDVNYTGDQYIYRITCCEDLEKVVPEGGIMVTCVCFNFTADKLSEKRNITFPLQYVGFMK